MNSKSLASFWDKIENNTGIAAIRNGMILAIPSIMAGSAAVLLNNLPIPGYRAFIEEFAAGVLPSIFTVIAAVTISSMPLILLLTISYSYGELTKNEGREYLPIVVVCAYMAFAADSHNAFSMNIFQNSWLFLSIFFALGFSALFCVLCKFSLIFVHRRNSGNFLLYTALARIVPAALLFACAIVLRLLLMKVSGSVNLQEYVTAFWIDFFEKRGSDLTSALLFSFLNQVLWFFGIHGSNVLDVAARQLFETGVAVNAELIAQGFAPTEVLSKSFMDVFVFIGGCGTTLSLILASLFFLRKGQMNDLSKIALFPSLFNINEMVLFGFPLVLNPLMFIPFVAIPCLLTAISWFACATGLVPLVTNHVDWTVPVFMSGYLATGSIRGALLQLVNLIVGTAIYYPFLWYYQTTLVASKKSRVTMLETYVKECERSGSQPDFSDKAASLMIMNQLQHDIENGLAEIFYQPQYGYDGKLTGAEALLRWNMEDVGYVYPPLVIALAEQIRSADSLDSLIIRKVFADAEAHARKGKPPIEFSFNVSPTQLVSPHLLKLLTDLSARHDLGKNQLCLEITEQAIFINSPFMAKRLNEIRALGIKLAMDDFGMGHTSLVHLSDTRFDMIKLDGSLIRGLTDNQRCADIILSIVGLSRTMGFEVLAEYVETREQRELLNNLGCRKYQGFLFSKPMPFQEFMELKDLVPSHSFTDE